MKLYVLFSECGMLKTTTVENYTAFMRNERAVTCWKDFSSVDEIREYWNTYFGDFDTEVTIKL